MRIKSIVVAAALIVSSQLSAGNLYRVAREPLAINQCPITETNNAMDLALMNRGYFVLSKAKKDSELLFTRYGRFLFDEDYNIRTDEGYFLMGVTKKSDAKHLNKLKISTKNLPPKATSKATIEANFPARAQNTDSHFTSMMIYDSLAAEHLLVIEAIKVETGSWKVKISVDEVERGEGTLTFDTAGTLKKQKGLNAIQWPADYGMHELNVDFTSSTQYASPFYVSLAIQDGYTLGKLMAFDISRDGEIELLYNNGQSRKLRNRIAVSMFTNPGYLELVSNHLYRPTDKSGQPTIHWVNSEYAIISGALEADSCLIKEATR